MPREASKEVDISLYLSLILVTDSSMNVRSTGGEERVTIAGLMLGELRGKRKFVSYSGNCLACHCNNRERNVLQCSQYRLWSKPSNCIDIKMQEGNKLTFYKTQTSATSMILQRWKWLQRWNWMRILLCRQLCAIEQYSLQPCAPLRYHLLCSYRANWLRERDICMSGWLCNPFLVSQSIEQMLGFMEQPF